MKYEGQPIISVLFQPSDQPLTPEELSKKLPFRAGSLFRESEVRAAIQNLFATGRYSDLAVDATESGDGVVLKFITQRAYFVGRVVVSGVKQPPNSGQLASATKLRLGAPYFDTDKIQAIESLETLLRQNGFYKASVEAQVRYVPGVQEANLAFTVDTGDRARFTQPLVTGHPGRSIENIVRATHWKRLYGLLGWQPVTEARLRQGLENIRHFYESRDLLESTVTLERMNHDEKENTVEPQIAIEAGPRILVRVEGAKIGKSKISQLVPVFQERSIDPDLLMEGKRNIQQYLQAQGYFGAEVGAPDVRYPSTGGADPEQQVITYRVDRGPRHKFVHLSIVGVHYFDRQTIHERLYIEPAEFPRFPFGRFSEAYLQQDVQSIRNLYAANGFRDVKVTYNVIDDYRGVEDHLAVRISVEEGSQWLVSSLSIDGVPPGDLPHLRARLASSAGQPFSEVNVADDRDNILTYYYGRGYTNATFEYYADTTKQPYHFAVRYVVEPGHRKYVRGVLISGLETTRPSLVNNLIELKSGEPLSLTAEADSQRRLYDLGIFARVNTAVQNPDGDEAQKYVLYDIDEARHYSLNATVGAQIANVGGSVTSLDNPAGTTGFTPRLGLGVSRINFLGLGQTISLQTAVSTIEQRAALTYFIPEFISHNNLSLTTTILVDNSNDIRTYTAFRREASIGLGQRLSRAYTLQYRLVFRHVTVSHVKIEPELIPLLSQPETVGLAEVSVIKDTRDDPTDAHGGSYTTADLAYAPSFLASQTDFTRGLFRNSTYYAFHRSLVFARSTQFGVIVPTHANTQMPLAERLYSGGSTSIRAFPDFQAGPRDLDTGFPIGGNALLINNLELRFPLVGDNLSAVLFEDAGNVYTTFGAISFQFRQPNMQQFNYMVQDAGIGIRYRTPIGPLRLDLSFSPDAPRFFGLKGTEQDLINGTAVSTVQKINAFQFHFSLGQAF